MAGGCFGGGNGSATYPYIVEDAADFDKINEHLAAGHTGYQYIQTNNFTVSEPIVSIPQQGKYFSGTYNGNGKTINLNIHNCEADAALFIYLYGTVRNLKVTGSVSSDLGAGSIASSVGGTWQNGYILNCESQASVSTSADAGGIARSFARGAITNCYCSGSVSGGNHTGGIAGSSSASLSKCQYAGSVNGDNEVGGIAGVTWGGSISQCSSAGSVSGFSEVGGILGRKNHPLSYCKSTSTVSGSGFRVGGIVGRWEYSTTFNNCYSSGTLNLACVNSRRTTSYSTSSCFYEVDSGFEGSSSWRGTPRGTAPHLDPWVDYPYNHWQDVGLTGTITPVYYVDPPTLGYAEWREIALTDKGECYDYKVEDNEYEVKSNDFQSDPLFDDLVPGTAYTFYNRLVGGNTKPVSEGVEFSTTKPAYWEVETYEDLKHVGCEDLSGNYSGLWLSDTYKQIQDITCPEDSNYEPVGYDWGLPAEEQNTKPFTGTYNGQGYKITNLNVNRSNRYNQALFGRIAKDGVVENIKFVSPYIRGLENVGTVAGYLEGEIKNCHVEDGDVSGLRNVGGIVGYVDGSE